MLVINLNSVKLIRSFKLQTLKIQKVAGARALTDHEFVV